MAAGKTIYKHEYVCEYRCIMYPMGEQAAREDEYGDNEEGCFIIEAKLSQGRSCALMPPEL